ncbi:unnamed protein product, partial [Polarella glacialis]
MAAAGSAGSSSSWSLPALLGSSAVLVAIFPERGLAVLLALAAIAASPAAASIFGGFSFPGLEAALVAVKRFVVQFLVEVLNPSLQEALPSALVNTFQDKRMAGAMVKMMGGLMEHPDFVAMLRKVMKASMNDEELLGGIKKVIQEALSDRNMYSSAMHGVVDLVNPMHGQSLSTMKDRFLGRDSHSPVSQ